MVAILVRCILLIDVIGTLSQDLGIPYLLSGTGLLYSVVKRHLESWQATRYTQ